MDYPAQLNTVLELETRQEDLLRRLEELDRRVEKVLADWTGVREAGPAPACTATE